MVAKLIALVLPLGLDTFAVCAALGMVGVTPERRLRVSLLMTGFEAGMPLVGLALGAPLGRAIGQSADYIAIGVLFAFGVYTLLSAEREEQERLAQLASMKGWRAALLGVSISLDELAVGFTLGLLRVPIAPAIVLIAAQTFVVSQAGMRFGRRLGEHVREAAERLAGAALTGLAIVLLAEKLAT